MSRTITTLKFIGTISLGLLTGVSYTLTTQALPALLTLPTATAASQTFTHLQTLAKHHLRLLTGLASGSLLLAFVSSPARLRHPYLLWTSAVAAAGTGVDYALRRWEEYQAQQGGQQGGHQQQQQQGKAWAEEGAAAAEHDVNGEVVRGEIEKFQSAEVWRAGVSGLAFAMGVVGIWGERTARYAY